MSNTFQKSFQTAGNIVSNCGKQMQALNSQLKDVSGMMRQREAVGKAAKAHQEAKQRMSAYLAQARQADGGLNRNATEFIKVERAVKKTARALDAARQKMYDFGTGTGLNGKKLMELKTQQEQIQKRIGIQSQIQRGRGMFDDNKMHLASVGMYATGVISNIVKVGADFEQTMAKVGAISRASESELQAMEAKARELGKATEWSAKEAGEGMQYLAMAGFKTNDIIKVMPSMLSLASAGALDLGTTADIASNILTGFGLAGENTGENMKHLSDVLALASSSANVNIQMIGESMKYVAPVAKAYGVSVEMATAMTAKLGDAGIQASQAGTTLRGILTRVSTVGQKAVNQLGIQTTHIVNGKKEMRSMDDIMGDLARRFDEMGSADKMKWANEIAGKQNMAGFLALVENSKHIEGSFARMSEDLKNADGTAQTMAERMLKTSQGQYKILQSAWGEFQISAFKALQPVLGAIGNILQVVVDVMNGLNEVAPWATTLIVGLTSGFAALAVIIPVCTTVWGALTAAAGAFSVVMGFIAANPIVLGIAALTALVVAIAAAIVYFDEISDALMAFRIFAIEQWNLLVDNFQEIIGYIGGVFTKSWEAAWNGVKTIFGNVFNGLIALAKTPLNAIIDLINKVIGGLNSLGGIEIAGMKVGFNIPTIPKLAQGGIVSQPTLAMIGEGRESEAVLPLSKLSSMVNSGGAGSGGIHVTQTITIQGGGGDGYAQVKRGLEEGTRNLKAELERLMANQRRVSYA